jgi:hypothetical protein
MSQTIQDRSRKEALEALAKLGGALVKEDDIVFRGTQFVIPETIKNVREASKTLLRRAEAEEEITSMSRTFPYRPWDVAAAVSKAIRTAFGFSAGVTLHSMFGSTPPQLIEVPVGVNDTLQVPWGAVTLPGLGENTLHIGGTRDRELGQIGHLNWELAQKYKNHAQGFFALVRQYLDEESIYRGHAIDGADMPNFFNVNAVSREDVVYTDEVMRQLDANVWSPIRHADQLAALGQSGKRSVLFEGPYGTGKTLGAVLTAQEAIANGWTFLICRPGVDDLQTTLQTARMYQPSVVFFEDLDTVGGGDNDKDQVTRILDSFDGMQTKGLRMLLVLTTNHAEKIHKGMIRPGRLDAVIHIGAMERNGVERLTRRVIGSALESGVDFDAVFEAMHGYMPAFVREALDRAVRYSVARNDGQLGRIDTEDLVLAAHGLRDQLNLMENASDAAPKATIEGAIHNTVRGVVDNMMMLKGDHRDLRADEVVDNASFTIRVTAPPAHLPVNGTN